MGLGFDACPRSRKTLIYLILTLNQIYPDYDFSQLKAHHFRKEAGVVTAEELIDSQLLETSRVRLCPARVSSPLLASLCSCSPLLLKEEAITVLMQGMGPAMAPD